MEQIEILKIIEEAFRDRPYPGDNHLASLEPPVSFEYSDVTKYFKGKHWKEITWKSLEKDYPGEACSCLCFMTPEAARFYLPAYMVIAINNYDEADVVASTALNFLLPPPSFSMTWWKERVSLFSQNEKKAIVAFLEYLKEKHGDDYPVCGPKEALEYWVNSI